jgi:hypothetical protein
MEVARERVKNPPFRIRLRRFGGNSTVDFRIIPAGA